MWGVETVYHAWPVLLRMPVPVEDVKVYIYFGKSEYDAQQKAYI